MGQLLNFAKAFTKRGQPLSESTISACKAISLTQSYYKVVYSHYSRYELSVKWPGGFSHPCYLQMVALPLQLSVLLHPSCPFKVVGLVHLHNRIVQTPDFALGQPFDLQAAFGRIMTHEKGVAAEVVLSATQHGKKVYEATTTFLDRGNASELAALDAAHHLPFVVPQQNRVRRELTELDFVSSAGREYASLSGDYNPIHIGRLPAMLFGFKHAIAHGMFSLARVIAEEERALDFKASDENLVVECDFLKPVYLPSTTVIMTGCIGDNDRMMSLHNKQDPSITHLFVRYARGEASRLHRRF